MGVVDKFFRQSLEYNITFEDGTEEMIKAKDLKPAEGHVGVGWSDEKYNEHKRKESMK